MRDVVFWFFVCVIGAVVALNLQKIQRSSSLPVKTISSTPTRIPPESTSSARVTLVFDGDTIQLNTGQVVRYIGIDTPEIAHAEKKAACFGKEAAAENQRLVLGHNIRLDKDISETDKYGRLLRYIWVDGIFVNEYLIRNGFARAESILPDITYQSLFDQSEQQAKRDNLGLWKKCWPSASWGLKQTQ